MTADINPLLLLRTIRHLRWEQLAYRPLRIAQYRLYRKFPRLALGHIRTKGAVPEVSPQTVETILEVFNKSLPHLNIPLAEYSGQLVDLENRRFTFLNRTLAIDSLDWNRQYESHLWNYHLHYFNFAVWCARSLAEYGESSAWLNCRRLIESWIALARIGHSDGWDAYPISLRVVNWIYAYALVAGSESEEFLAGWRASIFNQLGFLHRHLEHHLLANHLLKNIKALVIGGLFFGNQKWLSKGERLLWREFDEQVLPDGGHFERSPMYHAQTLTDFLECYSLLLAFGRIQSGEKIEAKLRAMAGFLEAMSYPDGSLALFNDSANTADTRPQPIIESAQRIAGYKSGSYPPAFPQSGYYLWSSADESEKIIVDAGEPSVAYNTAHAHCDLLSYELRWDGRPFIVDSGVHGYGGDRFRDYCRSTRAHNTVMFDGMEQSEVWDTFRMARAAKPVAAGASGDQQSWQFRGSSARFDNRLIHERQIHREPTGDWTITDTALNGMVSLASSFVHLHPAVEARKINSTDVLCQNGNRQVLIEPFVDNDLTVNTRLIMGSEDPIQGWYFPDFGIAMPGVTILFDYQIKCGDAFGYRIKHVLNK